MGILRGCHKNGASAGAVGHVCQELFSRALTTRSTGGKNTPHLANVRIAHELNGS